MHLAITERKLGDVIILDLTGRLWILDLPLRDLMNSLLATGQRRFVLNLASVEYIDSSGLGQLVSIWSSIRKKDGYMTLLNPKPRVKRLFEITLLNTVFEIFDKEPDAVQKAAKASGL
jgi:anti-sigma B factor antagonist